MSRTDLPTQFSQLTRKALALCERGILVINEEGKFTFSDDTQKNFIFVLVQKTAETQYGFPTGQLLPEPAFYAILNELKKQGYIEETGGMVGATPEGGKRLIRYYLEAP